MALFCVILPNLVVSGAHCIKLVDKAITINNWRLLCLVVNVCRGTAILDFKNVKVLTVEKVKKVEVHQRGKFPRNRTADEICEFQCYASLAWKCLYSRPFLFFGGTFFPNNVTHRPNPKMDHPWAEPRHLSQKPRIFYYWFLNGPYKNLLHVFPIGLSLRGPTNGFLGFINIVCKYFKSK